MARSRVPGFFLRFTAIAGPCAILAILVHRTPVTPLAGKWRVERLQMVDGQDSLNVTISGYDGGHMRWDGLYGKDTIMLQLSKAQKDIPKENY